MQPFKSGDVSEWLKESRKLSGESVEMGNFYVYIIQSFVDNTFYIGQCEDLDIRVSKHNEGMSKYSSTKRPWKLVYFERYSSRSEALKREKEIKKKKSSKYLLWLISNRFA